MKNVIEVVLDCGSYSRIIETNNHKSPMPFLNSIKDKGLWCTRAYSQGPYTESALMGLTFGKDTLNDNGYFDSMFRWKDSVYEVFKNNGYDVFVTYSYSVMPLEVKHECFYSDAMNCGKPFFSRFARSKLDYYYNIHKENALNEKDYVLIAGFLHELFRVMLDYCSTESLTNDCTFYSAYKQRTKEELNNIEQWRKRICEEYISFSTDQIAYSKKLIDEYDSNFIVRKCDLFASGFMEEVIANRNWIKSNKKFWRRAYTKKLIHYLVCRRERKSFATYFKGIFSKDKLSRLKSSEYFSRYLKATFLYKKGKMTKNNLEQLLPCARNDIDSFMNWVEKRNTSTPFYAYLHVDDYHGETVLCSYDSADKSIIQKEFENAKLLLKNTSIFDSSDVVKDMSLLYLDVCIQHLFDRLKEIGLLDDTIVVITADHGCSNAGGQFRYTNTNNFYDEQYHVPLFIYNGPTTGVEEHYICSKDIPLSLFDLCKIKAPVSYTGVSIYSAEKRKHTFVEYMGTGIPDLQRKPVLFSFRDHCVSYVLAIKLSDDLSGAQLLEYYDLIVDPEELNNIAKHHIKDIEELVKPFAPRLKELRVNYCYHINNIEQMMLREVKDE